MGRRVAPLLLVGVCLLVWAGAMLRLLDERERARAEAERARQHRRLEEAAQALGDRVERSSGLVRALADAASLREVVLDDAPEGGATEGWALVDRLLPRLAAEEDIVSVAVLLQDGEPLAVFDKRRRTASPPLAPPERPAVARRALDAPTSVVVFDLAQGAAPGTLQAAIAVGESPRRAVILVEVDAATELARISDAARDGAWALVSEGDRVLAPAGAAPPALPDGHDPRASGTRVVGSALVSAINVPGARREGWQLRARMAARSSGEVYRELVETLVLGGLPLLLVAAVLAWSSFADRRKRAEERERRFLEGVFNAIADPLIVVNADLVVTHANRAASARYGEPLVGRPYAESVAARRAAPAVEVEALREVLERGKRRRDEVDDARGGAWQVLRWPMLTGAVEYARDVTETKRLQAQLIQSEKLSTLGEMAAGIAHEVNNPIAVVSMFAELLQEDLREALGPEAPALEKLQTIAAQAATAGEIVKTMLRFSRKSEGARRRLDVRAAIERALALAQHRKDLQDVRIERAIDVDPPPEVEGDEGQLAQVVLNLVGNAAHAMKGRGGAVRVVVARAGEEDPYPPGRPFGEVTGNPARVRVAVTDAGCGIPPEVLERIFEPFYTTKSVGEGTGLGLSVSFAIIREHGGCMWVESRPGEGTTFTIDLPAASDEASGQAGAPEA